MRIDDARCSGCGEVHKDIMRDQGEPLPGCSHCGEHLVRLAPIPAVHVGGARGAGERRMRWAEIKPGDLDTADRASRTYYEMCRSHGIGRDRAREISAEAGPQTQDTAEAGRKAIEAKKAGSAS